MGTAADPSRWRAQGEGGCGKLLKQDGDTSATSVAPAFHE